MSANMEGNPKLYEELMSRGGKPIPYSRCAVTTEVKVLKAPTYVYEDASTDKQNVPNSQRK